MVEFTIKSNVAPNEAIRRFKRSILIGDVKVRSIIIIVRFSLNDFF